MLSLRPTFSLVLALSPLIRASQARGTIDEGVISPSFLFIAIKCFSYPFSSDPHLPLLTLAFLYHDYRLIAFVTIISLFCAKNPYIMRLKILQQFHLRHRYLSNLSRAFTFTEKVFTMKFVSTV